MDEKKRLALIKSLNSSSKFVSDAVESDRIWFIEKTIKVLEGEGLGDSAIETEVPQIVQKATTLVRANRDFKLGVKAAGNSRYSSRALADLRKVRAQILYGAIAYHRKFLEPAQLKYLLLIAKRRFRGICRMMFWVNPNHRGYFRYDHTCKANQHWRVNEDADDLWTELTPPWFTNYSPWKLNATGMTDPVKAIETLYVRKKDDPCKGNLFDCETTTSIVFMDSIREAKNEDKFIKKVASNGPEYILIHGFKTDGLTDTFVVDPNSIGLFSHVPIVARDLQVGDQCYIFNHALYKTFRPTGAWTGEYSLVLAAGDRNFRSKKGFLFGGHGKEGTLYKFYDDFLAELKSHLEAARQLMKVHLAFMRGGAPAILPGTVVEEEHDISVLGAAAAAHRLMEYDKNVQAKDFTKIPPKSKKKPRRSTPAFVFIQSKTEHIFYLEHIDTPDEKKPLINNIKKRIVDIVPPGKLTRPVKFKRIAAPPGGASPDVIYALDQWGVAYNDKSTGTEKVWPLFVMKAGKLIRNELTHDTLFDSPFSLYSPGSTDLDVYQPKVDFNLTHQNYLTTNEAM